MPKAKKMGRPKLPKGHAKGKIVPMRLNDADLKRFSSQAKNHDQNLSEWMRDGLKLWDDRLDENGVDALVWQGADQGDPHKKTLWIIFKEIQNGNRVEVPLKLVANQEQNHYTTAIKNQELELRGISEVWVTTTKTPFVRSQIHLRIAGLNEPVTIIKRY